MKRDEVLGLVIALTLSIGGTGAFVYAVSPTDEERRVATEKYLLKEMQTSDLYDQKFITEWVHNFENGIYDESLDHNEDFQVTKAELYEAIQQIYEGKKFRQKRFEERMREFN